MPAPLDAALTVHIGLADWVRVTAGIEDALAVMVAGRCSIEGGPGVVPVFDTHAVSKTGMVRRLRPATLRSAARSSSALCSTGAVFGLRSCRIENWRWASKCGRC